MIEGLIIKMGMDYIEYSDLEGETEKEKVISLFYLCQKQNLLNNLYAAIRDFDTTDLNLFIEKNIQETLKADIRHLSFTIPSNSCCKWRKEYEGEYIFKDSHNEKIYHSFEYPCKSIYICDICGKKTKEKYEHEWDVWKYENPHECTKIRKCRICGETERLFDQHIWQETNIKNGSFYRICTHCHHKEIKVLGKWKGWVHWSNNTRDFWTITINERFFGLKKPSAIVEAYINVIVLPNGQQYDYKVIQKGTVTIDRDFCVISCKKIKEKPKNAKYCLDTFEGNIIGECSYLKGKVLSGNLEGTLKLEPENDYK